MLPDVILCLHKAFLNASTMLLLLTVEQCLNIRIFSLLHHKIDPAHMLLLQKNLTVCILNKSGNLCFKFLNLRISSRVIHITRGESYQIIIRTEKIVALIRCLLIAAHQNLTPWLHLKPRDCIITIIFHKIRSGITLTRSNTLTEYFLKSASILLLPLS